MKFKFFYENRQSSILKLPAGTKLYHGTIEQYKKEKISPGGYDEVLWTAQNSIIARSYIPSSAGRMMVQSSSFVKPSEDRTIQNMQKEFGIVYDYSKVEFQPNGRVKSYPPASIFYDIEKNSIELRDRFLDLKRKLDDIKKKSDDSKFIDNLSDEEAESFFDEYGRVEEEYLKAKEDSYNYREDLLKNEYVNKKLAEYGYEPTNHFGDKNYGWDIKIHKDTIANKKFRKSGRLFTLIPKRELKIYDLTMGETIEPDLMDKQYHEIGTFRKAEESGYDGIKIADFAQSEHMGNVQHYSIGIFRDIIKELDIEEIEATHPDETEL